MKRILIVLYIVIIGETGLNIQAWAQNKTILILGDSISSAYGMDIDLGWANLLRDRLSDQDHAYEVVNASITGDVTASGSRRIGKLLASHNPAIVIIELGGNDGLRGLSLTHLQENLQSIIEQSMAAGARVVLAGMKILPNYGPRYTREFAEVYEALAKRNAISLVPFILKDIGGVPAMMQADGIHPNEKAQPLIVENIWPYLRPLLE